MGVFDSFVLAENSVMHTTYVFPRSCTTICLLVKHMVRKTTPQGSTAQS
jgi:hypothetical protein